MKVIMSFPTIILLVLSSQTHMFKVFLYLECCDIFLQLYHVSHVVALRDEQVNVQQRA